MENYGDNLIIGDLILSEVDYEDGTTHSYPAVRNKDRSIPYINCISELKYVNEVEEPTLIRLYDSVNKDEIDHVPIHDVILSNRTNLIKNVIFESGIGSSDHASIIFEINTLKCIPSLGKTYDYRRAGWEAVRYKFTKLYQSNKIVSSSPQDLLDNLLDVLRQTEKQSFKLKSKRYSNN